MDKALTEAEKEGVRQQFLAAVGANPTSKDVRWPLTLALRSSLRGRSSGLRHRGAEAAKRRRLKKVEKGYIPDRKGKKGRPWPIEEQTAAPAAKGGGGWQGGWGKGWGHGSGGGWWGEGSGRSGGDWWSGGGWQQPQAAPAAGWSRAAPPAAPAASLSISNWQAPAAAPQAAPGVLQPKPKSKLWMPAAWRRYQQ